MNTEFYPVDSVVVIKEDATGVKVESLKGVQGIVHAINRFGQSVIYGVFFMGKFEWIPASALDKVSS